MVGGKQEKLEKAIIIKGYYFFNAVCFLSPIMTHGM